MALTMTREEIDAAIGDKVISQDGEEIGEVTDIFYDVNTPDQHGWIALSGGFLQLKQRFVPLDDAQIRDDCVYVPFSKDQVLNAPAFESPIETLDEERTRGLVTHYGRDWDEYEGEYGTLADRRQPDDATITRHEEELAVGKRDVPAGRVRLRKWVETEQATEDVTLRRETAEVTREPIDEPAGEHAFEEREVDVPLHREEPVVDKRAVARERVGIEKDTQMETERVTEPLRKERVEVDEEPDSDERLL